MVNGHNKIGVVGVYLTMAKLIQLNITAIPMPLFWHFDLLTQNGIKIEVKFANLSKGKSGRGNTCYRFHFNIHHRELFFCDFVILVLNTKNGYLFYIIPKEKITCKSIAFNPFSKQSSKYEFYRDRWDLIVKESKRIEKKIAEQAKN